MSGSHVGPSGKKSTDYTPSADTISSWVAGAVSNPPNLESWVDLIVQIRNGNDREINNLSNSSQEIELSASVNAIHHIVSFLQAQSEFSDDKSALVPLMRLYMALQDLQRGIVSPMFKPQGKRGNSAVYEIEKGYAERALSELLASGMSAEEASRKVASACGNFQKKGRIEAKTVRNWRERLEQGPGPGVSDASVLAYKRDLPIEFGKTPKERGEEMLRLLKDAHFRRF